MSRSRRNAKAEEYFRRAPNYSAEAIESLRCVWSSLELSEKWPITKRCVDMIVAVMESAHKFALPDDGILFDRTTESMLLDVKPPFSDAVFEYKNNGRITSQWCSRAISVVMQREKYVWIFSVVDDQRDKHWAINAAWVAIPHALSAVAIDPLWLVDAWIGPRPGPSTTDWLVGPCGDFAQSELERAGIIKSGDADPDDFMALLELTAVAFGPVAQACAALSCTNVTTELIRPNREARAARPESTLFDYHVLMIRPGAERHEGNPLGGSHASPRTHLRRGHIRQHPTAGRIWVNSCVVNPTAIGTVNKDYRITP